MNIIKLAFDNGVMAALADLGLIKNAARPVYMSDEDVPLVPSKGSRPASMPSRPSFAENMGGSRSLYNSVEDAPVARQPVARQPVARQPVARQPVARQPVARQPVARQPVARQPVARQPVARQPVARQPVARQPAPAGRMKALYPNSPGYVAEMSRQIASGSNNNIPRTVGLDTRFNPRVNERPMPTPSVYPEWQGPILPAKQPKTYSSANDLDYHMEYFRNAFTGDPLPKVVGKNPQNAPRAAAPKKSEGPVNPMTRGLGWVYDNMI